MKRAAGSEGWLTPRDSKKGKGGKGKAGKGARVGGGPPAAAPGGIPWDHGVPQTVHAFKALVPDALAAALLGGGGSVKDQIQTETGSKLVFSNRGDYFPQSTFRVLGIYADDDTSILGAFDQVVQRVVELGEEERKNPPPGGPELLGKEPGEFVFRFCVTVRMCTQIIGTGGTNIQKIRHDSGAKVFIENDTHSGHRMGRVIGAQENILSALAQINELVQAECQEPVFVPFAGVVNFRDKDPRHLDALFADPSAPIKGSGKESSRESGKGAKKGAAPAFVGSLGPASGKAAKGTGKAKGPASMALSNKGPGKGEAEGRRLSPEEAMERLAEDLGGFPEGTTEIPYSMECEIPVSTMEVMGQPDESGMTHLQHVQDSTGTTINIQDVVPPKAEGEEEMQGIAVVGTLPHIYTAHAMLMMRSQQIIAEWQAEQEREAAANAEPVEDPEVLRLRILELQEMLKKAEGA